MKNFSKPELEKIMFGEGIITTSNPTVKNADDNTDDNYDGLVLNKEEKRMKKVIALILIALSVSLTSFNCFALSSDDSSVNLLTSQGKTGIVKEYSNIETAFKNAKSGDIVEITDNNALTETITADKSITVASGEKRSSNIIIGKTLKTSDCAPKTIDNVKLKDNGNKNLITFKNITVNGNYITETGDTNADKTVNIVDFVTIKKSVATAKDYNANTDINLDGESNANDITVLANILLGKY